MYLTALIKVAIKKYIRKFKRLINENWSKAVILEFRISPFE